MSRWWMNLVADGGVSWRSNCCFGPMTLMATTMAATAVAGGVSAASTIAGGNYAAAAGQMAQQAGTLQKSSDYATAAQVDENANQAIAASQRQMFDKRLQTDLVLSKNRAAAAASGVSADAGSPLTNAGTIARRGEYEALMSLWNGEDTATGLHNQAAGIRTQGDLAQYEGEISRIEGEGKKRASQLQAAGTVAGSIGSMAQQYGAFAYPTIYGRAGVGMSAPRLG